MSEEDCNKLDAAVAVAGNLGSRLDAMERGDAAARVRGDAAWNSTGEPDPQHEKGWGVEYRPGAAQSKRTEWFASRKEAQAAQSRLAGNGLLDINMVIKRGDADSKPSTDKPAAKSETSGADTKTVSQLTEHLASLEEQLRAKAAEAAEQETDDLKKAIKEIKGRIAYHQEGGVADASGGQSYKGYLIKEGLGGRDFHVSKDGHHVTTTSSLAAAKSAVDQLV